MEPPFRFRDLHAFARSGANQIGLELGNHSEHVEQEATDRVVWVMDGSSDAELHVLRSELVDDVFRISEGTTARAALVAAPSPLWRVERPSEDIRFSQINPVDALNNRAGIRYVSRLGDFECWAIFEGTPVRRRGVEPITARDADVRSVMDLFGITLA